jgi:hypothetical protein
MAAKNELRVSSLLPAVGAELLNAAYKNCINQIFASLSSVKLFIGIGRFFNANNIFIMNLESPGFETIAIAEYITGSCSVEYFLASLSGTGELER